MAFNPLPLLAQDFVITETLFTTVGVTFDACKADPTRWALIFGTPSGNANNISTNPNITLSVGIQIATGNGPISFDFRHHGPLVQQHWYGQTNPTNGRMTIIEVLYRPNGLEPDEQQWNNLVAYMGGMR